MNEYIIGIRKAELSMAQIEPFWGGTNHSREFMNKAFDFYFKARKNVNRAPLPYSREMQSSLDALADAGWVLTGVGDLIDAFRHLVATGGIWRDTNVSEYRPRAGHPFYPHPVRSATGVVNFVNALDAHFDEFERDVLNRTQELNRRLDDASRRQQWDTMAEVLDELRSMVMEAIPEIWPDFTVSIRAGRITGTARVGDLISITSYLENLKGSLDVYSEASNRGLSEDHARALAALRMAVSFVPGIGGIYARVIEMVPAMATAVDTYVRRANAIYEGIAARSERGLYGAEIHGSGGR